MKTSRYSDAQILSILRQADGGVDLHIIETIEEAQGFATYWLWIYNNDRPNMGIGGITPAQKLKLAA